MKVRVGKQPGGEFRQCYLRKDVTVDVALRILDLDPTGYKIRVNGVPAELTKILRPDDELCLVKA